MASLLDMEDPWPTNVTSLLPDPTDARPPALQPDPRAEGLGQLYSQVMANIAAERRRVWPEDNPVGTETTHLLGMPQATTYAGPVGQFINPSTGLLTEQGAARMENPALGFDTGGVGMIKAFHGSPHQFDAFDLSKIGTGEGAQAYGHGMYLAENEGVARNYRDALTPQTIPNPEFHALHTEYNVADAAARDAIMSGTEAQYQAAVAARDAAKAKLSAVQAVIPNPAGPQGHMYEVNVDADPERFLHWDKPLSEQHPDVQAALAKIPWAEPYLKSADKFTGGQITPTTLEGARQLQQAGIPGIRYLDRGSRGAGEGSHNYVVFDPANMNIIRRYGLAGLMAGASGAASLGGKQEQQ